MRTVGRVDTGEVTRLYGYEALDVGTIHQVIISCSRCVVLALEQYAYILRHARSIVHAFPQRT